MTQNLQLNNIVNIDEYEGIIINTKSKDENYYYIPLNYDLSNDTDFLFTITYSNNKKVEYSIDDYYSIYQLQEGNCLYIY